MGYSTHFTGEIRIDPPLPWGQIRDSEFVDGSAAYNWPNLKLHVVEEPVDTDDGTVIRKYANAIVPVQEDAYKGYDIEDHLQQIVDRYGAGRTFEGFISAEGESAGDLWRLAVVDGRATRIEPRIVWPDGSDPAGPS